MALDTGCSFCAHWQKLDNARQPYNLGICNHPNLLNHLSISNGWRDAKGKKLPMLSSDACREVACLCGDEAAWFEPIDTEEPK